MLSVNGVRSMALEFKLISWLDKFAVNVNLFNEIYGISGKSGCNV